MTQVEVNEHVRVTRMLRYLRVGTRVRATKHSATPAGTVGTVREVEPFSSDGVRRVRVRWDGEFADRLVLPSSIETFDA